MLMPWPPLSRTIVSVTTSSDAAASMAIPVDESPETTQFSIRSREPLPVK